MRLNILNQHQQKALNIVKGIYESLSQPKPSWFAVGEDLWKAYQSYKDNPLALTRGKARIIKQQAKMWEKIKPETFPDFVERVTKGLVPKSNVDNLKKAYENLRDVVTFQYRPIVDTFSSQVLINFGYFKKWEYCEY